MPIMYPTLSGLINNLTWSVSLQTPINTIIPQSSFDINGNYTAWLPNYGIGNYTLIATCNENYYASPEFRISYSVVDTPLTTIKGENITKYKKLIKHSKISQKINNIYILITKYK